MAQFKGSDDMLDELAQDLKKLGEDVEKKLSKEMLNAGGKIVVDEWKKGIESHHHVDTGQMRDSVKFKNNSKNFREIYPQGKDDKGVRNAEKAFVLHYGKSTLAGSRFVDEVESKAEPDAVFEMEKVFDDYLKKNGFY